MLLARYVAYHLRRRLGLVRLRRSYDRVVASAPPGVQLAPPLVDLPQAGELPEPLRTGAERLRNEADDVLEHRVDYLGSGSIALGPEIDWTRDFKSGYRWPLHFYLDLSITRLDDTSDAKVPWELSRGHQLLTLARAARLFHDERYAAELEAQLDSWLGANPPGVGINWVNTMEVALRAVNWIFAIGTVEGFRPLDSDLRRRVSESLQVHGRHIAANLEGTPYLRSNHFLSNILGLLALGFALPTDPHARRWARFARSAFEREMRTQVHGDGSDFEASLSYHGLVLEIFLVGRRLARDAHAPLSASFDERLRRMLAVSRAVRHADGRTPLFGDGDSGRALPGGFDRPPTQDPLLWLGAELVGARPLEGTPDEEVCWTHGFEAWRKTAELPAAAQPGTTRFPEGGLYVLRGGASHLVVRAGDVGQNGNGGHAHNDLLSYELSIDGVPLVVDSGTYAYTFDPQARNEFRSTAAHNVVVVDRTELNPIVSQELFRLRQRAFASVEEWRATPSGARLAATHDGWRQLPGAVAHRRAFEMDAEGRLVLLDELAGTGRHLLESHTHLAPDTEVYEEANGRVRVVRRGVGCTLQLSGPGSLTIDESWVSDRYGERERAPVLTVRARSDLPLTWRLTLEPIEAGVAVRPLATTTERVA